MLAAGIVPDAFAFEKLEKVREANEKETTGGYLARSSSIS